MDKRQFKDRVYSELAQIARALADARRLEIIELLAQSEYTVEKIASETGLSPTVVSEQLQTLKLAQLVSVRVEGNVVYYRLADKEVFKAWRGLRQLGLQKIEAIDKIVKQYRTANFQMESVTIEGLVSKLKTGRVTVLDVRPESEYKKGHIAGALSIQISELRDRLAALSKTNEIVAYCRGPFCVYADEAVAILIKAGYKATKLDGGFPDWDVQGLPVESN
jgi:rhodanese-related sulfurtransferase/DNA-binding HxlR family transcriptional regulator